MAENPEEHEWVTEIHCLEWCQTLFSHLLSNIEIFNGEDNLFIKTKSIEKFDGDVWISLLGLKIIPCYEISISVSWEGEVKDTQQQSLLKVEGTLELPNISDENSDEEPEVKITVKDETPIGKRLKEAFLSNGKETILKRVRFFVLLIKKGGPSEIKADKRKNKMISKGFKTLSRSERFKCRAKDLYDILMDENRWREFTKRNAKISKEIGGEFSVFDGLITGTNLKLEEGNLILQKWRLKNWADGIESLLRLTFHEPIPGVTIVKLIQVGVPEEDRIGNSIMAERTEITWQLILNDIRAVYGFGFKVFM